MSFTTPLWPRPSRTHWRAPVESDPAGLFSRAEAHAAGWTDAAIRHALMTGRWRRVAPGMYAYPEPPDSGGPAIIGRSRNLQRGQASLRMCPRAVLSHATAAIHWDLPTVCRLARPCLTVPSGTALRDLADVHLHRATLPETAVVHNDGVRVTSAARTVSDLAREHGVDAGVAAADAALHRGLVTGPELSEAVAVCAGWPGSTRARHAVEAADAFAESPLETLSRLRMRAHDLPIPELQAQIGDAFGTFVGRVDFYWPDFGVVGEADGIAKYDDGRDALVAERRRQRRLEVLGLIVVRWEWADLARFAAVADELRNAFARGLRPGVGRRWSVLSPCTRIGA